jgi:hypothetical protein
MRNGSQNDMFCTMKKPPIGSDTAYDNGYKVFTNAELPNACGAISTAEGVYKSGYALLMGNSLDAVFHVLTAYGVTGISLPNDQIFPNTWYDSLDPNTFVAKNISTPTGCTYPVVTCSTTPQPMPGPSPGCAACRANNPGQSCCLLGADSLAPTCICGSFGDCKQFGSTSGAVFCPPS